MRKVSGQPLKNIVNYQVMDMIINMTFVFVVLTCKLTLDGSSSA